jgi:hypothetical protein
MSEAVENEIFERRRPQMIRTTLREGVTEGTFQTSCESVG